MAIKSPQNGIDGIMEWWNDGIMGKKFSLFQCSIIPVFFSIVRLGNCFQNMGKEM
jgi:hypothetical protein